MRVSLCWMNGYLAFPLTKIRAKVRYIQCCELSGTMIRGLAADARDCLLFSENNDNLS